MTPARQSFLHHQNRNRNMFDKIKKLLFPLLMVSLFIFWIYDKDQKKSAKQENVRINKIKIENAENELIEKLASKYNAQLDWDKGIRDNTSVRGRHYFTIDLQKAVEGTDKKPVALKLIVEDIYKEKDKVMVRFRQRKERFSRKPTLLYELECNEELVGEIRSVADEMNRRDFLRYKLFLVIASLDDVNMHKLEIRSDEMSGDVYASDFDLPHYISGECIDLEQIGQTYDYTKGFSSTE